MSAPQPVSHIGWLETMEELSGLAREIAESALEGSTMRWAVDREHITKGATFSREAMNAIRDGMVAFVEARIMARWDQTGEPPSHLEITLDVTAA